VGWTRRASGGMLKSDAGRRCWSQKRCQWCRQRRARKNNQGRAALPSDRRTGGVQEFCTAAPTRAQKMHHVFGISAYQRIKIQNFCTCLCKRACMNSVCEVQEFCTQETRLWAPRAHEEEARSRVFHTHRYLHCGTKGVEKGSGQRLYSPGASLYKGSVQRTRSGRVRIDDCRISARLCASHLHGNADLPGTWFKPHCAGYVATSLSQCPCAVGDEGTP